MKPTLNDVWDVVWAKKFSFLGTFFIVFFCTYMTLVVLDILPESPDTETNVPRVETVTESHGTTTVQLPSELSAGDGEEPEAEAESPDVLIPSAPMQITIPRLDRSVVVLNPVSRAIADLDEALLEGVVRHPDSALLGQPGTVFILGHSSYLPSVRNRNFQAFNGIQNLAWGDTIELEGTEGVYIYRVERVYKARAQEVVVPIAGDTERLVLATCNSFGSVDDRHIVEAVLVSVRS